MVLIETLWNVNLIRVSVLSCGLICINRNIVECKLVKITKSLVLVGTVLIETLWNVNSFGEICHVSFCQVLIETLWNVNQLTR